jgi:holliday junction DNA helicase RuvA
MIGRLRGILEVKKPPYILIDVSGVGYELQVPMSTLYQLPELKEPVVLLTHFYVREDHQMLYGFYEERERTLFRSLIKISGVGPKMALTILSGIEVGAFIQCVENRDYLPLVRLPGVGKKTAERLIVEMAGKLKNSFDEEGDFSTRIFNSNIEKRNIAPCDEAISALIALGYKPQEASRAIQNVMNEEENGESKELIRRALKGLAKV